jgi:hypothetical protein
MALYFHSLMIFTSYLLPAPTSKPQFLKYLKRGYHIEVVVETAKSKKNLINEGMPGFEYWQREFDKCCQFERVDKMRDVKVCFVPKITVLCHY